MDNRKGMTAPDETGDPLSEEALAVLDPMGEMERLNQRVRELEQLVSSQQQLETSLRRNQDQLENALQHHAAELEHEHKQLQRMNALLKATLNSTTDGILVLDKEGQVVICNQHFMLQWGIQDEQQIVGERSWMQLLAEPLLEDSEAFIRRVSSLLDKPDAVTRDVLRFVDGRIFEGTSHPQKIGERAIGRVWSFRDITKQMHAQELIEYQATYDALTDLPNRRLLLDRLNQMLSRCRRHHRLGALLFLDLDNFKTINDTLGHPVGDALLQQVAKRLVTCLRKEDTAARLGGDEFVLLFSEFEGSHDKVSRQVEIATNKVLGRLSEPYEVQGHKLYATPSIGVTLFPADDENADDVLRQADTAMYRAKDAGRNTARFFLPSMQASSEQQLRMQNELRNALDNEELNTHWQPQLDINGKVVGAEALLRWQHPEQGLVMPKDFIRMAEESGIITALGDQALERSCALLRRIADQQPENGPIYVSVNVSPQQFQQADFPMRIAYHLEMSGANPAFLTLELTENMLVSNLDDVMAKMVELKRLGVRFSIDDFGTGYSSLTYLKRLPLDEIKIDRSFVCDIIKDPETVSIVEAIITMASKLGLSVVAEGVETNDEYKFLKRRGCHAFQGNMFCEPLDESQFWDYLQQRNLPSDDNRGTQSAFEGF